MLKFAPFSSNVEASFWIKLSDLKLHKLRLSEEATCVRARYGIDSKQQASMNSIARVRFDQDSFDLDAAASFWIKLSDLKLHKLIKLSDLKLHKLR